MRRWHWIAIFLGIFIDQATKYWASEALSFYKPIIVIPSTLAFHLVHNYGAAYGILQNQRALLIGISTLVVIVCIWLHRKIATSRLAAAGLSCLLIGTVGNLIDRVSKGYVVDFLATPWFPVFNLADVFIDIAIGCFAIDLFVNRESHG